MKTVQATVPPPRIQFAYLRVATPLHACAAFPPAWPLRAGMDAPPHQLQMQQLPYLVVMALALAGGGGMGHWGLWAARSPAVRAVLVGGAHAAGRAFESSAAATPTIWLGIFAIGAAVALAAASLALACACGGGAATLWNQVRPLQAGVGGEATQADVDELAREIHAGGWNGPAHRAASQQLRAQPLDIWRWAAARRSA